MAKKLKPKTNPFDEALKDEKKEAKATQKAKNLPPKKEETGKAVAPVETAKEAKRGRGRPKIDPNSPNHRTRFILWIPQGILDEVRKCASDSHVTISKYIVDLLEEKNGKTSKSIAMAKLESLQNEEIAKAKTAEEVQAIIKKYDKMKKKA